MKIAELGGVAKATLYATAYGNAVEPVYHHGPAHPNRVARTQIAGHYVTAKAAGGLVLGALTALVFNRYVLKHLPMRSLFKYGVPTVSFLYDVAGPHYLYNKQFRAAEGKLYQARAFNRGLLAAFVLTFGITRKVPFTSLSRYWSPQGLLVLGSGLVGRQLLLQPLREIQAFRKRTPRPTAAPAQVEKTFWNLYGLLSTAPKVQAKKG